MSDDPPFLPVGTEISAKFKGAFCEAKVKKAVRNVKCKVTFKDGQGGSAIVDECSIKSALRVGAIVPVVHPETKQLVNAAVQNIKDCSTYTVVFDDGDERVLRRTQMCLKGGKHFHASESLDVMPLTKPEQFGAPVVGRNKGGRRRRYPGPSAMMDVESDRSLSTDEEETQSSKTTPRISVEGGGDTGIEMDTKRSQSNQGASFYTGSGPSSDYGRVVCVYEHANPSESRRWFPALIVSPKMKKKLKINADEEYLVRSFKDGRCIVVRKTRVQDFNLSEGMKVDIPSLKPAVEKAILYLEKDELPPNWDRELLLGDREDDDTAMERTSSPSSADSPRANRDTTPEQWNIDSQHKEDGPGVVEGKGPRRIDDQSLSPTSDSPPDQKDTDLDFGDKNLEGGSGSAKASGHTSSDGKQSRHGSPNSHAATVPKRRSTGVTRKGHQQPPTQQRRKGAGMSSQSEKKDRFVAQLYKFMDERGTPLNKAPVLAGKELDLYLFYDTVKKLGGYNRVCHKGEWKTVIKRMNLTGATPATVKNAYNRYLFSFDSFYRKLGSALVDLKSPVGESRVSRRERHASKSGTKPTIMTPDIVPETTRRNTVSRTSSTGNEGTSKTQKFSTSVVSKFATSETTFGPAPKVANSSREASKERSTSPFLALPHPPLEEDLVVGARVKVQYGSGNHRKLYQAKIMKVVASENRYMVHYLGWNTRYDESVPKSRIVEVMSTVTKASSDSGGSNNDNGGTNQKISRPNSRSRTMDKPPAWRRRRSSGGSTHSLPVHVATNDDDGSTKSSARKSSSIAVTTWRKDEKTELLDDDDGDESGKEGAALLSSYRPKLPPTPTTTGLTVDTGLNAPVKRPASANAASENREKNTVDAPAALDGATPTKRPKRSANSSSSSSNKRKKSPDDSDDEETKNESGNSSRRVSKRLRGVKASIEEEIYKQMESAQSENEETPSYPTTPKQYGSEEMKSTSTEKVSEMDTGSIQQIDPPGSSTVQSPAAPTLVTDSGKSDEIVEENDTNTPTPELPESEEQQSTEAVKGTEETKPTEGEKRKETTASSSQGTSGNRSRSAKMRRRRRNYSHMVTDHRNRSTASKSVKKEVDSDADNGRNQSSAGSGGTVPTGGSRHTDGTSPRDPNSLHALRHRIQAEMDADPSKFHSNFTFNIIDESLDCDRKIQVMQTNITELKETYLRIRSELSAFEKCRKKLLEKKQKQEKRSRRASSNRKQPSSAPTDSTSKKQTSPSGVEESEMDTSEQTCTDNKEECVEGTS